MVDYTSFKNRYYFKGQLIFQGPAHIGSGYSGKEADSAFILDNENKPLLPGSSIKGAMRSLVERLLAATDKKSCVLYSSATSDCLTCKYKDENMDQEKIISALEANPDKLCDICWLFGTPFWASKIKIKDASCTSSGSKLVTRYGVGINRETGAAEKNVLFSFETTPPMLSFDFELIGDNLTDSDRGVLALALQMMMQDEFSLGAKSTCGFGRCKLTDLQIKIVNEDNFVDYLTGNTIAFKPENDSKQRVKKWLVDYLNETHGEHDADSDSK
jgi:CRISPR-associated protein Csm3